MKARNNFMVDAVLCNPVLASLYGWCIQKASPKQQWVPWSTGIGKTEAYILEGEFPFGRHSAGKELKIHPSTLLKRIKKLESYGVIQRNISNAHYTKITVKWWDKKE